MEDKYSLKSEDSRTVRTWLETTETPYPEVGGNYAANSGGTMYIDYLNELTDVTFINLANKAKYNPEATQLLIAIKKYFHIAYAWSGLQAQADNKTPDDMQRKQAYKVMSGTFDPLASRPILLFCT
jgi:hypothetical protein